MDYRPDDHTIISFLYGELGEAEKAKVEKWIAENPAEQALLQQLKGTQHMLQKLTDKEVIVPKIPTSKTTGRTFRLPPSFKIPMGIAAALLTVVAAIYLLGINIQLSENGLHVGVNPQETPKMSEDKVQALINNSISSNNESIRNVIADDYASWKKEVDAANIQQADRIDQLVRTTSRKELQSLAGAQRESNIQLIKNMLGQSSDEQIAYFQTLLTNYSDYMETQRVSDLNNLQSRIGLIEQDNNRFAQETEYILSNIITNMDQNQVSTTDY